MATNQALLAELLPTDYKDYILQVARRKYNMIKNADGTVSFDDVTPYDIIGDVLKASDINAITQTVNNIITGLGELGYLPLDGGTLTANAIISALLQTNTTDTTFTTIPVIAINSGVVASESTQGTIGSVIIGSTSIPIVLESSSLTITGDIDAKSSAIVVKSINASALPEATTMVKGALSPSDKTLIDGLKTGDTIVGKATNDDDGNEIKTTYVRLSSEEVQTIIGNVVFNDNVVFNKNATIKGTTRVSNLLVDSKISFLQNDESVYYILSDGSCKLGTIEADYIYYQALPLATNSTQGAVIIGDNITLSENGTISVSKATTSSLGLVKIGDNIELSDNGTISIPEASADHNGVMSKSDKVTFDKIPSTYATKKELTEGTTTVSKATSDASGNVITETYATKDELTAHIGSIISIKKSLTLTTDWQDTGISGPDLSSGTYVVRAYFNAQGKPPGIWYEAWSGIFSWYSGNTNSSTSEEIILHNAGHADNSNEIYLRTIRTFSSAEGVMKLQIACKVAGTDETNVTFSFRKLL